MMQQFAGALGTAMASLIANSQPEFTSGVQSVYLLFTIFALLDFIFFFAMFYHLGKKDLPKLTYLKTSLVLLNKTGFFLIKYLLKDLS